MGYLTAGAIAILLLIIGCIISNKNSETIDDKEFDIKYIIVFDIEYYLIHNIIYTIIIRNKGNVLSYKLDYDIQGNLITSEQRGGCTKIRNIYDNLLKGFSNKICSIESEEAREDYIKSFIDKYNGELYII